MSKKESGLPLLKLGCLALTEEREKAWFLRLKTNGLYEYDRLSHSARVLERFSTGAANANSLYLPIEKIGDILILGPWEGVNVLFYDIANHTYESRKLVPVENDRKVNYTGTRNFYKSYSDGNNVYLFGYEYPAILRVDVGTGEIAYLTDWVVEVEQRINKTFASMGYVSDYVVVGDCLWALCECVNAVLRMDLKTYEVTVVDIFSKLDIQCGICFDGSFWVTGYSEGGNWLLKCDEQFSLKKEFEIYSAKDSHENYDFSLAKDYWVIYPVIDLGETLFLFSVYPSHVYEFNKSSEQVSIHPVFEELAEVRDEKLHELKILVPRRSKNFICFLTGNDYLWNAYDFAHNTLIQDEVRGECEGELLQEYSKILVGRTIGEEDLVFELGYKLTLSRFLEHMKYIALNETVDRGKNNSVGIEIYKELGSFCI